MGGRVTRRGLCSRITFSSPRTTRLKNNEKWLSIIAVCCCSVDDIEQDISFSEQKK